jgi:glucose-6-phosphate 1-epimerase
MAAVPATWPLCRLHTPEGETALISLHGAQVLSWRTANGHERLYLSPQVDWQAVAQGRYAIRGGIPLCWPQFNRLGALPKHGFARLLAWNMLQQEENAVTLCLRHTDVPQHLLHSAQGEALWPHAFEATLQALLSPGQLTLRLQVHNTGNTPLPFTAALHGHLAVDAIGLTRIMGAEDLRYRDAILGTAPVHPVQQGAIGFSGEVDRVYPAFAGMLACGQQRMHLRQSASFGQTVVWNPGATLCDRLPDLPSDAWHRFVCIEPAQIDTPVHLAPDAIWQGWQSFQAD